MQDVAAELLALADHVQPQQIWLEAEICLIGRSKNCTIVVHAKLASRQHARIERAGARYTLIDLQSANGTYVNGRRITEPHPLVSDDIIGIGMPAPLLRFLDHDETVRSQLPLSYDERMMQFYLGHEPIQLSQQQLRLLAFLFQHAGRVCTREQCAAAVWGADYDPGADAGRLDQLVSSVRQALRKALRDKPPGGLDPAELIQARRGIGYILGG